MFCNQCGQANSDNAKFCSGCGSKLENKDTPNNQIKPLQPNNELSLLRLTWLTLLFIVSLVMLLGVLPYQIYSGNFEFSYILGIIVWGAACHYCYKQIFSKKLKSNSQKAFNALDEAELWFNKQDINTASIHFNSYDNSSLLKNKGATLLVGVGENSDKNYVGFAVEVKQNCGVLSSLIIEPSGIATQDKKAAQIAITEGKFLIDVLNHLAIQHRIKYPQ